MPITPYLPRTQGHRSDTCNDQVVGAILSGWRYDISEIPKDLRGDYEQHLVDCTHCRRRQRRHRTIDFLLVSSFTLSFAAFLLFLLGMHRWEASNHVYNVHVSLHPAAETNGALARIPASITLSLGFVAISGVVVSLLLGLLVALATPVPSILSAMFRERMTQSTPDDLNKQAA